jgi:DNA (cytosine-5)-methyltransferase 1
LKDKNLPRIIVGISLEKVPSNPQSPVMIGFFGFVFIAGFDVVFANDICSVGAGTYMKNINIDKDLFYVGNVEDIANNFCAFKEHFKDIDLLCGGPPCQGFSMANRQRIIDGPRNVLYKSFLDILSKSKPKFFVMENVKGMQKKIDEILSDFNTILKDEYSISYGVINAKDYGIPQNRERLFVIGSNTGIDVKSIFENIYKKARKPFTLRDAISDLPPLGVNKVKNKTSIENEIFGFFKVAHEYERNDFYRFINGDRDIAYVYNHKNRYNNERDVKIYELLPQGANSLHPSIAEIMPYKTRNHIFKDKYFKLRYDDVCKTITSHMKFDCNMYIHPTQPRGLSAREAARIQTFPDNFIFTGAQNSWYMQIGNAVPVKLAEIIGGEIIKCL